jgi:outer membrane protein TolC
VAYFDWKRNFNEVTLYQNYLTNAEVRYKGITKSIEQGDKPAIDSVEAGIIVRNRKLSLEESRLKLAKAQLELSNFLWLENNVPLELQDDIIPEENLAATIKVTLQTNELMLENPSLENHPKINALENKIEMLEVERKLKANMLLPQIDLGYSYLSEPSYIDNYRFQDYKVGLNFSFPVFLRKERGSLQLAKFKLQDARFDLDLERVQLKNKIKAQQTEIASLERQQELIESLVNDYSTMLTSEERLFSFGESSIFLINSRENNLVAAQLSKLQLENRFLDSNATLFKIMANPE